MKEPFWGLLKGNHQLNGFSGEFGCEGLLLRVLVWRCSQSAGQGAVRISHATWGLCWCVAGFALELFVGRCVVFLTPRVHGLQSL